MAEPHRQPPPPPPLPAHPIARPQGPPGNTQFPSSMPPGSMGINRQPQMGGGRMRAGNGIRIGDVKPSAPQKPVTHESCYKALTTHRMWTIRKRSNDEAGRKKDDWQLCQYTEDKLKTADILARLKQLNSRNQKNIVEKKKLLSGDQDLQINHLINELTCEDEDENFEWTLEQLEIKYAEKKGKPSAGIFSRNNKSSKGSSRKIDCIFVYLKRAPRDGVNCLLLKQNLDRPSIQSRLMDPRQGPPQQPFQGGPTGNYGSGPGGSGGTGGSGGPGGPRGNPGGPSGGVPGGPLRVPPNGPPQKDPGFAQGPPKGGSGGAGARQGQGVTIVNDRNAKGQKDKKSKGGGKTRKTKFGGSSNSDGDSDSVFSEDGSSSSRSSTSSRSDYRHRKKSHVRQPSRRHSRPAMPVRSHTYQGPGHQDEIRMQYPHMDQRRFADIPPNRDLGLGQPRFHDAPRIDPQSSYVEQHYPPNQDVLRPSQQVDQLVNQAYRVGAEAALTGFTNGAHRYNPFRVNMAPRPTRINVDRGYPRAPAPIMRPQDPSRFARPGQYDQDFYSDQLDDDFDDDLGRPDQDFYPDESPVFDTQRMNNFRGPPPRPMYHDDNLQRGAFMRDAALARDQVNLRLRRNSDFR